MRSGLLMAVTETEFPSAVHVPFETIEALDDALIAGLSPADIARMTEDELVRVVRAARLPLPGSGGAERLELYDRPTLGRLAYAARRCCQNRILESHARQPVVYGGESCWS